VINGIDVPTGRRLEEDGPQRPDNWFGSLRGLPDADDAHVEFAARYFRQASAEDFEVSGKDWVEKESGSTYRIPGFDPLLAADPTETGVEAFVVRDGTIIFLCPAGSQGHVRRVVLGSVGGMPATGRERI
jgi:hypothetical protein